MEDSTQFFLRLALAAIGLWIGKLLYAGGKKRTIGYPTCITCRHNLTGVVGVSEQCPECGTVIHDGQFRSPDAMRPSGVFMRTVGGLLLIGSALILIVGAIIIVVMLALVVSSPG